MAGEARTTVVSVRLIVTRQTVRNYNINTYRRARISVYPYCRLDVSPLFTIHYPSDSVSKFFESCSRPVATFRHRASTVHRFYVTRNHAFLAHPVYWVRTAKRNVLYQAGRYITESRSYARRGYDWWQVVACYEYNIDQSRYLSDECIDPFHRLPNLSISISTWPASIEIQTHFSLDYSFPNNTAAHVYATTFRPVL